MRLEVSHGELIDKYTILKIKSERITDANKLQFVNTELESLLVPVRYVLHIDTSVQEQIDQLYAINQTLWDIENSIREKERKQEFDQEFINIARSVYHNNDLRAKIKAEINRKTNSTFAEVKQYSEYPV